MVILDLLITLSTFRSSSIRECIITIVLGIAALLREWCWLVWKEMIPNLCRCSWDSNRKHSTYKFNSWEEEAIQAAKLVWGGRKWTRIKVTRLGTVGFESIFPLKKKKYTKWQQWGPAFKSACKHQCSVLRLVVLKTSYFIFKQHAPLPRSYIFSLFK